MATRNLFFMEPEVSVIPEIAGLSYVTDYVSAAEEQAIVAAIDAEPWDNSWERRRQLFGGDYGRSKQQARPIPVWGLKLADRILRDGLCERRFDHMLVNEYLPGQGIALHCDYEPFDRTVASLSLLAPCVMDFRHVHDGRRKSILLQRRSLLILSDEARYQWQHGIARRKKDRWGGFTIPRERRLSVTFRTRISNKKSGKNAEIGSDSAGEMHT